jgi:hypothetical protein
MLSKKSYLCGMEKIMIAMSPREYKKFLAFKEADRIARSIRRGLDEVRESRAGRRRLKSARELANEL